MRNETEQKHGANQEAQLHAMAQTEMKDMEFACEECPMSFRFQDDWERHVKLRHGVTREVARQTIVNQKQDARRGVLDEKYPEGWVKKKAKPRGYKGNQNPPPLPIYRTKGWKPLQDRVKEIAAQVDEELGSASEEPQEPQEKDT